MVRVFLAVIALVGIALLFHWFLRAEPRQILRALRWGGLAVAAIIAVALVAAGQFQLLYVLAVFLVPWIMRARSLRNRMRTARGPTAGQASEVRTRFVVMQLDHDTGSMDGIVQEGPFAGKRLSGLRLEDVVSIYRDAWAADRASAQVLQAYLERMHGDAWRPGGEDSRDNKAEAGPAGGGTMSAAEARSVLGVGPKATDTEIKQAHRRLMKQFHPDRGGSDYLAARINEAKEVLLGDR
jgi:hypothetical protein